MAEIYDLTDSGPVVDPDLGMAILEALNENAPRGATVASVGEAGRSLNPKLVILFGLIQTILGGYTVPQLKTLVRTLRRLGFKTASTRGLKADIAASIETTITGHMGTLSFTDAHYPPMPNEIVRLHGHYGTLGENAGDRVIITDSQGSTRIEYDADLIMQAGLTPSADDRRQHVNTGYDATLHPEQGPHHLARGVMQSGDRFGCRKNKDFYAGLLREAPCRTMTGIPSCVPGDGLERGRAGSIEPGVCRQCGGPSDLLIQRHGVSSLNATFRHALIIKPDGTIPVAIYRVPKSGHGDATRPVRLAASDVNKHGPSTATAQVPSPGGQSWDYETVPVVQWIGPEIRSVHLQKVGGRHAIKENGRTVWYSGSFARCMFPTVSFGDILVWCFICNRDKVRRPDFNPAQMPPAAQAVIANAVKTAPSVKGSAGRYMADLLASARIGGGGA